MVFRGLFGLSFNEDGLSFLPVLPNKWGEIALVGLTYRDKTLDIYLRGNGTILDNILLDSEPVEGLQISAEKITDKHKIEIYLS